MEKGSFELTTAEAKMFRLYTSEMIEYMQDMDIENHPKLAAELNRYMNLDKRLKDFLRGGNLHDPRNSYRRGNH